MHARHFGAALMVGAVLFAVAAVCAGNDRLVKPYGPQMCKQLCNRTVRCVSPKYIASELSCETTISMVKAIVGSEITSCSNGTRTFRSRKGHAVCMSEATIPLHQACMEGKLNMVKHILMHGLAVINSIGELGRTPVMAASSTGQLAVFTFLVSQGCNMSVVDQKNNNIFHVACIGGNTEIVRNLIEKHKFDIERRGVHGSTAVMLAARFGHVDVYDLLVEKGCNLSVVNDRNNTILHKACVGGHINMIRHLLAGKTCDINYRGANGKTPLLSAVRSGHVEVVQLLVWKGCNVTVVDNNGNTVLHVACKVCRVDMIKYIINLKAGEGLEKVRNKRGKTPRCAIGVTDAP